MNDTTTYSNYQENNKNIFSWVFGVKFTCSTIKCYEMAIMNHALLYSEKIMEKTARP
jgi:hypothetical protein